MTKFVRVSHRRSFIFLEEIWFGKDNDVIAMFTCYTRQQGKCTSGRMQALIENNRPFSFFTLQEFNNILVHMFQNKYRMFIDQHTGSFRL